MSTYTEKQLAEMKEKIGSLQQKTEDLKLAYIAFGFQDKHAWEYAHQGFIRRIDTLYRCILNVFGLMPPDRAYRPEKAVLDDLQIHIQAFMANIYGATDNLAWVWVFERRLSLARQNVGLRRKHSDVRSTFSDDFRRYLEGMDDWFEYVVEYRDALAHRIPLYIPLRVAPEQVARYNDLQKSMQRAVSELKHDEYEKLYAEQDKMLVYQPYMTHALNEAKSQVAFHAQMICDLLGIEELGRKMLIELKGQTKAEIRML